MSTSFKFQQLFVVTGDYIYSDIVAANVTLKMYTDLQHLQDI